MRLRPIRRLCVPAALAALLGAAPAVGQTVATPAPGGAGQRMDTASSFPRAELQGLDKVTARVSSFTVPVGEPVLFGSLVLRIRACWKNPPEETPESAAYLEVTDRTTGSDRLIFSGWMYASSPGINALEHPVYDVWVLGCLAAEDEALPGDEGPQGETEPKG